MENNNKREAATDLSQAPNNASMIPAQQAESDEAITINHRYARFAPDAQQMALDEGLHPMAQSFIP